MVETATCAFGGVKNPNYPPLNLILAPPVVQAAASSGVKDPDSPPHNFTPPHGVQAAAEIVIDISSLVRESGKKKQYEIETEGEGDESEGLVGGNESEGLWEKTVTEIRVIRIHIIVSLSPLFVAYRAWYYRRCLVDAVWEEMFTGFVAVLASFLSISPSLFNFFIDHGEK